MKKHRGACRLAAVLMGIQVFVLLFFAGQKKGYFIDEIYSWGLSNGYYKPFVTSYDVFDRWISGEEFANYITVQEGERFAYPSVYYNQTQDVHPPLFYMLMHTVCSFTPEVHSKWQGIFLNVFFYAGCLCLIFGTARNLMESDWGALAAMALWGLSPGGLSTGVYVRMYMMMTFFSMASVYLHVRMAKEGQSPGKLLAICAATFLGLLTQYYFVFMAFFLSAFYVLWKLWRRAWGEAALYCGALLGSVGLMVLAYPACIAQLTRTDEFVASQTKQNLLSGGAAARNLISYVSDINMDFFAGRIREAALLALLALALCLWRRKDVWLGAFKGGGHGLSLSLSCSDRLALALAFVWILSFLAVSMAAVVTGVRYIYNLYPLFSVLAVWAAGKATGRGLWGSRLEGPLRAAALGAMVFLLWDGARLGHVRYLYPENEERARLAEQYRDRYCLYIDNFENAPLTQDLMELSKFRGLYVMPMERIERVEEILGERDAADGLVVYVDTNAFWSSGYDGGEVMERLKDRTGAAGYELLYSNELSETYLLKSMDRLK